ncbi:F0F1 ATP synthase subunit epsilon [Aureimonas psammosilenae]|uniref:F0F1 ATP synthase subunit epsilon n=1 Tax=Aureimonas psammosilenae TaxID=2495496 RepID=UPI001260E127|nr:F0F1 ATP synthase subunit epsilon [Aureimonas psammosilenae]
MADSFSFELVSPERLLVSEQVTAVVAPATEGYMTVMARHAPLMTTLKPGVVTATLAGGTERRFFVQGGFADISPEGFTLLAEHATPAEELDAAKLDEFIRKAEEVERDAKTPEAKLRAVGQVASLRDARSALGL